MYKPLVSDSRPDLGIIGYFLDIWSYIYPDHDAKSWKKYNPLNWGWKKYVTLKSIPKKHPSSELCTASLILYMLY